MFHTTEAKHEDMVRQLIKSPSTIKEAFTDLDAALIHSVMGVAGEAGELIDAIKKAVIYRKPIDRLNIIEELGDLEFYMQDLRDKLGISRNETLQANMDKLQKRYPNFQYTDQRAHDRADKI